MFNVLRDKRISLHHCLLLKDQIINRFSLLLIHQTSIKHTHKNNINNSTYIFFFAIHIINRNGACEIKVKIKLTNIL
jgi:hypothetical protein